MPQCGQKYNFTIQSIDSEEVDTENLSVTFIHGPDENSVRIVVDDVIKFTGTSVTIKIGIKSQSHVKSNKLFVRVIFPSQ